MTKGENTGTKPPLKIWAFQHVGYEDLGSFEYILQDMNADIRYICGRREDLKQLDASEPDVMVVLGGPMGLYQTDIYPYLLDEVKIVEQRLRLNKPMLGICLGAQIIAQALGSKVYKGPNGQEIGWAPITLNEAGEKTVLHHIGSSHTNMMHWHGDTFDMPDGAVHLASSARYQNQAFSYGDKVLAVQCHPEITPRKLNIWLEKGRDDLDDVPGLTVEHLLEETEIYGAVLKEQARAFFTGWLNQVLDPQMLERLQGQAS